MCMCVSLACIRVWCLQFSFHFGSSGRWTEAEDRASVCMCVYALFKLIFCHSMSFEGESLHKHIFSLAGNKLGGITCYGKWRSWPNLRLTFCFVYFVHFVSFFVALSFDLMFHRFEILWLADALIIIWNLQYFLFFSSLPLRLSSSCECEDLFSRQYTQANYRDLLNHNNYPKKFPQQ